MIYLGVKDKMFNCDILGNIKNKSVIKVAVLCAGLLIGVTGCGKKSDNESLKQGMELIEKYDYNGAIECFEQAILNNEDSQLIYRGEGLAFMGLGDYVQAEEAFLHSISCAEGGLSDLVYDTNYYLAATYMKQNKYNEAENLYTAIIDLKAKETQAYYLRACSRLKQGNYEAAVNDFGKAFALAPNDLNLVISAYKEMQAAGYDEEGKTFVRDFMDKKGKSIKDQERGILYFYLEDYENARMCLEPFMNGNNAEVSLILGQTYEKMGDMNYASIVYQTYIEQNEPNAEIYNSLGSCLLKQGKYAEALDVFNKGIELGESDCYRDLQFNLIVATEYNGDFGKAKVMMEEYMNTYPEDTAAKREYQFLQTR